MVATLKEVEAFVKKIKFLFDNSIKCTVLLLFLLEKQSLSLVCFCYKASALNIVLLLPLFKLVYQIDGVNFSCMPWPERP